MWISSFFIVYGSRENGRIDRTPFQEDIKSYLGIFYIKQLNLRQYGDLREISLWIIPKDTVSNDQTQAVRIVHK